MPRIVRLPNGEVVEGVPPDVSDEQVLEQYGGVVESQELDQPTYFDPSAQSIAGKVRDVSFGNRFKNLQDLLQQERPGAELSTREFGEVPGEITTRFRAAGMDTPEEKVNYLQQAMPEADILLGPGGGTILIKPPGQEQYVELDSPAIANFGEMIDFARQTTDPGNIAAIASMFLTKGLGGPLGTVGRNVVSGAASFVGEQAESAYNRLLGYELETPQEVTKRAAVEGGMEAAFGLGGDITRGGWKFLTGQRPEMPPEIADMLALSRELEMSGLRLTDVHPITSSLSRQAAMTTGTGLARDLERQQSLLGGLTRLADSIGAPEEVSTDVLGQFISGYEKKLQELVGSGRLSSKNQGRQLHQLTQKYFAARKVHFDRLYGNVRDIAAREGLEYDVTPAILQAQELLTGTETRFTKPLKGTRPYAEGDIPLDEAATIGPHGEDITPEADYYVGRNVLIGDPAAVGFLNRVASLYPKISHLTTEGGDFNSAFDQLKELRTEAFNLKDRGLPSDPMMEQVHSTLSGILDNPSVGSQEYKDALRVAESQYRNHTKFAEKLRARQLLEESANNPSKIGSDFISPENADRVDYFRAMIGSAEDMGAKMAPDAWDQVRGGYITRLLRNPGSIENELRRWGGKEKSLRHILHPDEQEALTDFSLKWRQLQKNPVYRLYRETDKLGTQAVDAMMRGDRAAVEELVAKAGGKEGDFGKLLREGVFMNIVNKSTVTEQGRTILSPTRARGLIDQLRRSGYLGEWDSSGKMVSPGPVLTEADATKLDLFDKYLSILPGDVGVGESLQAAQLASSLARIFPNPNAVRKLGYNYLVAKMFMADNAFTRFLLKRAGTTYKKPSVGVYRPLLMSGSRVMEEISEDAERLFPEQEFTTPGPVQITPSEQYDMLRRTLPDVFQ